MYFKNVELKVNGQMYYSGELDVEMKCTIVDNKVQLEGRLADYIFGETRINPAMLPYFEGWYEEGKNVYYKVYREPRGRNGRYSEIYMDEELVLSGYIDEQLFNCDRYEYHKEIDVISQFSKILLNLYNDKREVNKDLKYTDSFVNTNIFLPQITKFMRNGKLSINQNTHIIKDFSKKYGEIDRLEGVSELNVNKIPVKYIRTPNEICFMVNDEKRWSYIGKFNKYTYSIRNRAKGFRNENRDIDIYGFEGEFIHHGKEDKVYKATVKPTKENRELIKDVFYMFIESKSIETRESKDAGRNQDIESFDDIIGLEKVKAQMNSLRAKVEFDKEREKGGLPITVAGNHMVFMGAPGTGKTTIARKIGKFLKANGVLKKDEVLEVSRKDLVAEYIGQTGPKISKVLEKAKGGVLFIDEAYSLVPKDSGRDFGQEAIAELIAVMENCRDDLIVIFAGYEKEMERMLDENPGMESRISHRFKFEDYSDEQLLEIFKRICEKEKYVLPQRLEDNLQNSLAEIRKELDNPTEQKYLFGNGRGVRSFFEAMCNSLSLRRNQGESEDVQTFDIRDIDYAVNKLYEKRIEVKGQKNPIGFVSQTNH